VCDETCEFSGDGECDDGGPDSQYSDCGIGTDCTDCCGPRAVPIVNNVAQLYVDGVVTSARESIVTSALSLLRRILSAVVGYCWVKKQEKKQEKKQKKKQEELRVSV